MFCPKCGNNNPEEVRFCKVCGHPLNLNNPTPTVNQAQPAQQFAPATAPRMMGKPKSKYGYLFSVAPKNLKTTTIISLILGVVCILAVVFGANSALNGDFFEIPMLKMIVGEDEIDEAKDALDEAVDAFEVALDEGDKEKIEELEDEAGMKAEKVLDLFDPPSLNSIKKFGKALLDDDSIIEVYSLVITIITIYALIAGVSLAMAMLVGRGGYAIFTLIVVLPFHIFLSGSLWLIVGTVAHLAFTVCLFKMTSAYKKYKKSFKIAK